VEGAQLVIDALGRRCPVPVIELARHLRDVDVGEVIAVLADDAAARADVPAWCGMRGQEYVGAVDLPEGRGSAYLVRRLS
jgi:TusA-related sulfurtransferase